MLGGQVLGFAPSCVSAAVVLALVLVITHPVEGMPLLTFSLRTLRGLATVAAIHDQEGVMSAVGRAMQVSPQDGVLLANDVYDAIWEDERGEDLLDSDWEYLGGYADVKGEGLSAADNPFTARQEVA